MAQAAIFEACDICEKDALWYCVDCQENLCEQCKAVHVKSRKTRNDYIVPARQAKATQKTTVIFCELHSSDVVNIHCLHCDKFLCFKCFSKKHKDHKWTTLEEFTTTARDELDSLIEQLHDRLCTNTEILDSEKESLDRQNTSVKVLENSVKNRKTEVFTALSNHYDEQMQSLSTLHTKDQNRYTTLCSDLQAQNSMIQTAVQTASCHRSDPVAIQQATQNVRTVLQGLVDHVPPTISLPKLQLGDINKQDIINLLGNLCIDPGNDTDTAKPQVNGLKVHARIDERHKTGIITQTLKIRGISDIQAIIPMDNNSIWVATDNNNYLTLVDKKDGQIIKNSIKLSRLKIIDAKKYKNSNILVCSQGGKRVLKMSDDGESVVTFIAVGQSYCTGGLCVTHDKDVLVCLKSPARKPHASKIIRINQDGGITQEIQYDSTMTPLFHRAFNLTSLSTGEIVVIDRHSKHVLCLNKIGVEMFKWSAEDQDVCFSPYYITHDKHDNVFVTEFTNGKVHMVAKDGTMSKCLVDKSQGIKWPMALTVDTNEQLLIGCNEGEILFIAY